ncbi:hypothetical protein D3C73_1097870 [compost metagenome]
MDYLELVTREVALDIFIRKLCLLGKMVLAKTHRNAEHRAIQTGFVSDMLRKVRHGAYDHIRFPVSQPLQPGQSPYKDIVVIEATLLDDSQRPDIPHLENEATFVSSAQQEAI